MKLIKIKLSSMCPENCPHLLCSLNFHIQVQSLEWHSKVHKIIASYLSFPHRRPVKSTIRSVCEHEHVYILCIHVHVRVHVVCVCVCRDITVVSPE